MTRTRLWRFSPLALVLLFIMMCVSIASCDQVATANVSKDQVKKVDAVVKTDINGKTTEQENVIRRLEEDNRPGAIKHLYLISAYSGQVLLYSTVKGKVTSSGKRLNPITVSAMDGQYVDGMHNGLGVVVNGETKATNEVRQDDGTYGSSIEYIYWWDSKGIYHQQYITGGMILHVSSQPIAVKGIVINLETNTSQ